jgi:quinol monooxygenase YgiN
MFGLVVRFELLEGHEEAFDGLVAETLPEIRSKEPGTVLYVTHRVVGSLGSRVFYEFYEDEQAFQAHEATEHVKRFLADRTQHLQGDPEAWFLSTADGVFRPVTPGAS